MGKVDTSKQKEGFELGYESFEELLPDETNPVVLQLKEIEKYLQEYRQFLIETRIREVWQVRSAGAECTFPAEDLLIRYLKLQSVGAYFSAKHSSCICCFCSRATSFRVRCIKKV